MVVLSSPRRCIRFRHTADHCHSLVVVQNIPDEPPKSAVVASCACRPGASYVGRVPGFQKLSRGFCRLIALLPSLPPPGSLYPGLPKSSLPSLRHPTAFLTTRAFFGGDSDPPWGQRSLYFLPIRVYLLPMSLSLSTDTYVSHISGSPRDCLNP